MSDDERERPHLRIVSGDVGEGESIADKLPLGGLVPTSPIQGYRRRGSAICDTMGPRILQLMREGHSVSGAAALCGISERSVSMWVEKGTDREDSPAMDEYRDFAQGFRAVQALIEKSHLDAIVRAGDGELGPTGGKRDWRAHAWLLGVKFPLRYREWDNPIEGQPSRVVVVEASDVDERQLGRTTYDDVGGDK